jgi:hypothetical protein
VSLLTDYTNAQKELDSIQQEKEQLKESIRIIEKDFDTKIQKLKDEKDKAFFEAKKKVEQYKATLDIKKSSCESTIKTVHRIQQLMEIVMDHSSVTAPEVYVYSDKDEKGNYLGWNNRRKIPIDPIKTIKDDEYSIFNLYIVPNTKPTNKYSLIVRGYSIFGDLLKGYTFGSISGVNESSCNFYVSIKYAPTEKELLAYVEKHINRIMETLPLSYDEIVKEYKEAEQLLKEKEWQIFYWEGRKYYYENHYSHGTETKEYKAVLKKLAQLKSN